MHVYGAAILGAGWMNGCVPGCAALLMVYSCTSGKPHIVNLVPKMPIALCSNMMKPRYQKMNCTKIYPGLYKCYCWQYCLDP